MKTMLLATSLTLISISTQAAGPAAGTYKIDVSHSKMGFEVQHLVVSTVEGRFRQFEGSIQLETQIEKSKVEAKAQISSIDTSEPKRDDHLKSPDFFDAAKHPTMTFVSKKIGKTKNGYNIEGDLTIKGITKRTVFESGQLAAVTDGFGQQKLVLNAKAEISRKEFGLKWNDVVEVGPVVGDKVKIALIIQAVKSATNSGAK